jgi:hypothetical protein
VSPFSGHWVFLHMGAQVHHFDDIVDGIGEY